MNNTKTQQNLNQIFNTEVVEEKKEGQEVMSLDELPGDSHLEEDYTTARNNLSKLLKRGETLLDLAIGVAQDTESSKEIEAATKLLSSLADINNKLLDLNIKRKNNINKKTETPAQLNNITNNTMFVGTSSDLVNLIKHNKVQPIIENKND